ncbi:hypothetical protein LTR09_011778 [Extremus antarcticus]|uniref:FAD-binding PCMH-type domain-containing protein n=1 Tax=Extremus antarcticus TaxID=702011 RepID=A0AAJ0D643_9PEZI|nr:hypothetical protein LTR09_011778 [Extremus antarcticus]
MASLQSLKVSLRNEANALSRQELSDNEYSVGFNILMEDLEWQTYQKFIVPQLSQLLASLFKSRFRIAILEIGPGPRSILEYLPDHQKDRIRKYAAFEPNAVFASRLEERLCNTGEREERCPLPRLEGQADIRTEPFVLDSSVRSVSDRGTTVFREKFDVVLFCHSMYGMKPKEDFIRLAIGLLVERMEGSMVVVFHRDDTVRFDGLVCHWTASYPAGVVRVPDDDEKLEKFASFITGFTLRSVVASKAICASWRKVCRTLGAREPGHLNHLSFSSPHMMAVFTRHATALLELTARVPTMKAIGKMKSREARLRRPACVVKPTTIPHLQECVRWAVKYGLNLSVIGGGHSDHCIQNHVVAVDMSAFDRIHKLELENCTKASSLDADVGALITAEAGCMTGNIVSRAMAAGLAVPMGARPSVGAGLWLQGGIGHLARLHGLACDAIIGAIVVSVDSGCVLCVGYVPMQHIPTGAVHSENDINLLWAMKGAGTNFGIVVSVTFKAYTAPLYSIQSLAVSPSDELALQLRLREFAEIAGNDDRTSSADAFLYREASQLRLGVTMFASPTTEITIATPKPIEDTWGLENNSEIVDGVELFDAEMYVSGMHAGTGEAKTSSFKRCLFLKDVGDAKIVGHLATAVKTCPSSLCYIHLLQGGGAVCDVAAEATAFGCRDWDFACVITGVWRRDCDGTRIAQSAVQWVYDVAQTLLPWSCGTYGADLGPGSRDAALAAKAFGPNRQRLAHLKHSLDPHNVLAYACPLLKPTTNPKLIILVTGESGSGKDYCANLWVSSLKECTCGIVTARASSISDAVKREYASATGADLTRLLNDRAYKEQHRAALTAFFQDQVKRQPGLPEEQFLSVVQNAEGVDVLLITGMRDVALVTNLSPLVPDRKVLQVHVQASVQTRRTRGALRDEDRVDDDDHHIGPHSINLDYRPNLIFDNDTSGSGAAEQFARNRLLPLVQDGPQRLANMVRAVPNFPRPGMEFQHILGISQQPGGLDLCVSLLQAQFTGDWATVDAVACCEVGGLVYASALATRVALPLVLIREAGKLPTPTVSVAKLPSHISSLASDGQQKRIEIEQDVLGQGANVLVVDDVLSTGETLCAVLDLLEKAGIDHKDVSVMTVAEFPIHRGRQLLHNRGFGRVSVHSLLVFDGV